MASIDRSDPVIMGHILAQHRELHAQLMAVRALFAAPTIGDRGRADTIRAALVKLREHLRSHFEQEEAGGYMEESIARVPRLAAAVKAVLGDHPVLLVELDRLIELLAVPEGSPAFWERVDRGYEGFARHLVAHEKSENAVVQEGYNEDLGLV